MNYSDQTLNVVLQSMRDSYHDYDDTTSPTVRRVPGNVFKRLLADNCPVAAPGYLLRAANMPPEIHARYSTSFVLARLYAQLHGGIK